MPADPKASKKARFGFTAAAYGIAASSSTSQKRSTPASVAGKAVGKGLRLRVDADTENGANVSAAGCQALEVGAHAPEA